MKRKIILSLIGIMIIGSFSGCGGDDKTNTNEVKESTSLYESNGKDSGNSDSDEITDNTQELYDLNVKNTFEDFEYIISKNENGYYVIISKYLGDSENVVVPGKIDGIDVTVLGDESFCKNEKIKSITLPDEIQVIERKALYRCLELTDVKFGKGLETIEYCAFSGCDGLVEVNLPENLISIEESVFMGCDNIEKVSLPEGLENIGSKVFHWDEKLVEINVPDSVISIGSEAFFGTAWYNNLPSENVIVGDGILIKSGDSKYSKEVVIPDGVKKIGSRVFMGYEKLQSVQFPKGILEIGQAAFANCKNLKSMIIPDTVTTIGDVAFSSCTKLSSLEIPKSVTNIGYNSFIKVPWFDGLSEEYAVVGDGVLIKTNVKDESITIPTGVKRIAPLAIANSTNIKNIEIPSTVEKIYDYAFYSNRDLISVKMSEGITDIGIGAFQSCRSLKEIVMSETLTYIGEDAFTECGLTNITIPKRVTTMNGAFDENITIKGIKGSPAETYAVKKGYAFEEIK